MNKILLAFVCLVLACSQPSGTTVAPSPDVVAPAASTALSRLLLPAVDSDHVRASGRVKPVPQVDPRTAQELAYAACRGADGVWHCNDPSNKNGQIKPLMASGPIYPTCVACSIPDWYLDPNNGTGCASDANSCTSATCGGAGIGPCLTMKQIVQRLSPTPQIAYGVTITVHQLSKQPSPSDSFYFDPKLSGGGNFVWLATPSTVGAPFSPVSVTAKVQTAGGNDLRLNGGLPVGAAVGQIVHNTSLDSYAFIDAIAGGNATVTQPIAAAGLTTIVTVPNPVEDNGWTALNTYQLLQPLDVYWKDPQARGGDVDAATQTQGVAWIQGVHFVDVSGIAGFSEVVVRATGCASAVMLSSFDPFVVLDATQAYQGTYAGNFLNGGSEVDGLLGRLLGGSSNLNGLFTHIYSGQVDLDCILHGLTNLEGADCNVVAAHNIGNIQVKDGSFTDLTSGAIVWGAGTLDVSGGSNVQNQTGGTFAASLKLSALTLDGGITTGSTFNASAVGNPFVPGIPITAGNMDTGGGAGNPGIQNPRTGSRYSSL